MKTSSAFLSAPQAKVMMVGSGKSRPIRRMLALLSGYYFFTISSLFHAVLVVVVGTVVLFKHDSEPADFVAGEGESFVTEVGEAAPKPASPAEMPPELPEIQTTLVQVSVPVSSVSAITTSADSLVSMAPMSMSASMNSSIAGSIESKLATTGVGGSGLGGGGGGGSGFFGSRDDTGAGFAGTFYDLKQTKDRKPTKVNPEEYTRIVVDFVRNGWRDDVLDRYFSPSVNILAGQIFTPSLPAEEGPKAFGAEREVKTGLWLVHYRARVSPPESGTYYFVGSGDDVMMVRFDNKLVLDRGWDLQRYAKDPVVKPTTDYDYGWTKIPRGFAKGQPMRLIAGQYYSMDVLIGESPGVLFHAALMIEKEGVEYKRDARGNPILPVFRLFADKLPELGRGQTFPPHEENGPVWKAQKVPAPGTSFGAMKPKAPGSL